MCDNSVVLIRPIVSSDEQHLREFLDGLDEENPLGLSQLAPCAHVWFGGAFSREHLVGLIVVSDLDGHSQAILAVGVDWRRKGVGSALVRAAIARASVERKQSLRMIGSRLDWPMRKFLSKAGAKLDLAFDGIVAEFRSRLGSKEPGVNVEVTTRSSQADES
jgi:GNAT superfamily N-acetyltransferase